MQKEHVMFLMSMTNTMSKLWPAPIEMDFIDERKGQKHSLLNASRWAICSDIIRQMMDQMSGCDVNVSIGKCTDDGVNFPEENSEENLKSVLCDISETLKGEETTNIESAIREIETFAAANSENKNCSVHWFMDTDTFVTLKSYLIDCNFSPNIVVLYVIGELETLHDNFNTAKDISKCLEECNVDIRYIVCPADLSDLTRVILSEKRYETTEKEVRCRIGKKRFGATILLEHEYGKTGWQVKLLDFVGFLPQIEVCRLGFSTFTSHSPESKASIYVETEPGKSVLWSIATFMLSDNKNQRLALFKYYGEKLINGEEVPRRERHGYCMMLAYENDLKDMMLTLIRLPRRMNILLSKTLKYAEQIDEPKQHLPDKTYEPVAPEEHRVIKRRLADIGSLKSPELKKTKFNELADEYDYLGARDTFMEFTAPWQKQNGFQEEVKSDNGND